MDFNEQKLSLFSFPADFCFSTLLFPLAMLEGKAIVGTSHAARSSSFYLFLPWHPRLLTNQVGNSSNAEENLIPEMEEAVQKYTLFVSHYIPIITFSSMRE
uniref:Uncharacterized protein n=1 Tax=Cannabis sativa TaxID=3483 RepID=A0A803NY21_CANSA